MKKQLLAAAVLSTMTLPALASNLYVVADIGQVKYEVDSYDETKTGFTLGGGYKFNDTFAVEVAYRNLGEIKEREYEDLGGGDYYEENFKNEFSALQVSLVAGFPVSEAVNLYGRLGYADIDLDYSFSDVEVIDGSESTFSGSGTLSKSKVLFGIGASYSVSDAFSLRAEYGQYGKFEDIKISSFTLGLTYGF